MSRSFALGAAFFVALVLLLSLSLVACDDSPPTSSGVELDIDHHHPKTTKTAKPAAPKKTLTTKGRR